MRELPKLHDGAIVLLRIAELRPRTRWDWPHVRAVVEDVRWVGPRYAGRRSRLGAALQNVPHLSTEIMHPGKGDEVWIKYHDRAIERGGEQYRLLPLEQLKIGMRFWFLLEGTPVGPFPIAMSRNAARGAGDR